MIKSIVSAICAAALLIVSVHAQTSKADPIAGAEVTGTIKEYTPGSALVLETLAPFGLIAKIEKKDSIQIPAYNGSLDFKYSKPVSAKEDT